VPLTLRFQGLGTGRNPLPDAGEIVVALRVFLLFACDLNDIGLDGMISVECRSPVAPRTVLQADIFIG
jgi:hypothetical protein